jgi:hypothetical protein
VAAACARQPARICLQPAHMSLSRRLRASFRIWSTLGTCCAGPPGSLPKVPGRVAVSRFSSSFLAASRPAGSTITVGRMGKARTRCRVRPPALEPSSLQQQGRRQRRHQKC